MSKRDRRGPPVKLDAAADEKDLHAFTVARERALKKADRPKEVRKIVLDALKTLINVFKGEAKDRKASSPTCDSDEPGSPEVANVNSSNGTSANGAPHNA